MAEKVCAWGECNKFDIPKWTKKQTSTHKKKSLMTTPVAKNAPVLYPYFIPVLISEKNAGPNENVNNMMRTKAWDIKLKIKMVGYNR